MQYIGLVAQVRGENTTPGLLVFNMAAAGEPRTSGYESELRLRGKGCVVPSLLLVYSSIMTANSCILRNEFNRFIEQLTCEEFKVADRLLTLSERICCEFVFFLCFLTLSLGSVISVLK